MHKLWLAIGLLVLAACLGFASHLTGLLNGIHSSIETVVESVGSRPSEVHNQVTIEALTMTKITLYKYDKNDNIILQATFCYDPRNPDDLERIRKEWEALCKALG